MDKLYVIFSFKNYVDLSFEKYFYYELKQSKRNNKKRFYIELLFRSKMLYLYCTRIFCKI